MGLFAQQVTSYLADADGHTLRAPPPVYSRPSQLTTIARSRGEASLARLSSLLRALPAVERRARRPMIAGSMALAKIRFAPVISERGAFISQPISGYAAALPLRAGGRRWRKMPSPSMPTAGQADGAFCYLSKFHGSLLYAYFDRRDSRAPPMGV